MLLRQTIRLLHDTASRAVLWERLRRSRLWAYGTAKLEAAADFYEFYVTHFPYAIREHVDLRAFFAFKNSLIERQQCYAGQRVADVVLDASQATPARRVVFESNVSVAVENDTLHKNVSKQLDRYLSPCGHPSAGSPWKTLLESAHSMNTPSLSQKLLELGWDVPLYLWDTILAIMLKDVDIRFNLETQESLLPLSYGLSIQDLGMEFECQQRIRLNVVCRELLVLNHSYDPNGYFRFNEKESGPLFLPGLPFLGITHAGIGTLGYEKRNQPSCPVEEGMFSTPEQPCAAPLSTIPNAIIGDVSDDELCELESVENNSPNHLSDGGSSKVESIRGRTVSETTEWENMDENVSHGPFSPCVKSIETEISSKTDKLPIEIPSAVHPTSKLQSTGYSPGSENAKLITRNCRPQWTSFSLTCITKSIARQRYHIELPIFLDVQLLVADVHVALRPKFLDEVRGLWMECVSAWYEATHVHHVPDHSLWTSHAVAWDSATRARKGGIYCAEFFSRILQRYYPTPLTVRDPAGFWKKRLKTTLDKLEEVIVLQDTQSPFVTASHGEQSPTWRAVSSRDAMRPSHLRIPSTTSFALNNVQDLQQRQALENSQVHIRLRLPAMALGLFPLNDTPPHGVQSIAQIYIPEEALSLATVRRDNEVLIVASCSRIRLITRDNIQQCLSFLPIFYYVVNCRVHEVLQFLSRESSETLYEHFIAYKQGPLMNNTLKRSTDVLSSRIREWRILLKTYYESCVLCQNPVKPCRLSVTPLMQLVSRGGSSECSFDSISKEEDSSGCANQSKPLSTQQEAPHNHLPNWVFEHPHSVCPKENVSSTAGLSQSAVPSIVNWKYYGNQQQPALSRGAKPGYPIPSRPTASSCRNRNHSQGHPVSTVSPTMTACRPTYLYPRYTMYPSISEARPLYPGSVQEGSAVRGHPFLAAQRYANDCIYQSSQPVKVTVHNNFNVLHNYSRNDSNFSSNGASNRGPQ